MFVNAKLNSDLVTAMVKVDPEVPRRLFMAAFGLQEGWKVATKSKAKLSAALVDRAKKLGDRLEKLVKLLHAKMAKIKLASTVQELWTSIAVYILLPVIPPNTEPKDHEYTEVEHFIHGKVPPLDACTPLEQEPTQLSHLWGPIEKFGISKPTETHTVTARPTTNRHETHRQRLHKKMNEIPTERRQNI